MPTWKAQQFFRQMIAGVKHIHNMGIAHRDIKPENLLLTKNGMLTIFQPFIFSITEFM